MKKSLVRYISLGIVSLMGVGGLLSLSSSFDTGSSSQFINKKDNDNALIGTNVNNHQFININSVNTEGTKLPSSGGTLDSGTYYLDSDMELTNYITAASGKNIIINLNGFSLSAKPESNQPIVYVKGGTLTINGKDDESGNMGTLCNGTGYYDGSYTRGGVVAIYADGTNMGNATINDCNIANNKANFAGAIFVSKGTTGTLNNCNVYNNESTSYAEWGLRGIIYVEDVSATVNINGGEIYNNESGILLWSGNNRSSYANLNGVYIHDNGRFGVRVNGTDNGNPALTIAGDTIIKNNPSASSTAPVNLRLNGSSQAKVAIASALGDNACIGVTMNGTAGVFTASADTSLNDLSKFFSDDASYAVAKNSDGQLYLSNAVATVTSDETVTEYSTFSEAVSAWNSAANGANLTLLKDATISSTINVSTTKTLDLNGCGINASGISSNADYVFLVNNGGNLTLNDSGNTTHYFTHERYKDYDAGLATICDKATYEAASEDSRGTFEGGYLTGLSIVKSEVSQSGFFKIEENSSVTMNGGTIIGIYADYSSSCVCSNGTFIMNDGNMIYNVNARGCINARTGILTINGGNISHNTDKSSKNTGRTAALWLNNINNPTYTIRGGTITNNVAVNGAVNTQSDIAIEGNPVIKDNIGVGIDENSDAPMNIVLSMGQESKLNFIGEFTGSEPLGVSIYMDGVTDVTNSAEVTFNNRNNVVSDNPNYAIGLYPTGHNKAGQLFIGNKVTVTYTTEHGTAPVSDTMATGSIISSEPTSPSEEGYVFKGWYKDEGFENAWDFATDTVTSDTTLYAKWFDEATAHVIKLINDIGDLTYDGGVNDSLNDIITAKAAYDALTPTQQAVVNKENKDVLDYDILTYRHVDNVGDLIKEIPEASDSQEYYDAVDTALAAYNALTDVEEAILNADLNFQYKDTLDDNIAVKDVIELIQDIGEVTYNGGQDDSKDDINAALDAYNNLTEEQKNIVNNVNKDVLDDSKDSYDKVDETVKLIESIGDVSHGGESDSKEAIDAAKDAFESLTPEQQALVASYNNSEKVLEDDEAVYSAMEAIDSIGDVSYTAESEEAIKHAQEVYDSLTEDQKEQLGDAYRNILIEAGNKYEAASKQGDILFLILIIVTSLTLIGGIWFLFFLIKKKKKDEDDDDNNVDGSSKKEPVKAYSFGGLLPGVILVSHYLDTKYIILYVLAALAIVVWIVCLIMVLTNKRKKAVKEETKPQQAKETKPQENNEDEEEVETITDEKGNVFQIRFIKSFTAKLIQSPEETKKYYEELKNEVLSYKKTNSRISWHFDSVNSGRNYVLKFAVRGKTLCVYLPLNADDYTDSKYKVEKADKTKRYEDVPTLYRIKNDRRCAYAKELIAVVANNLGLEKGEEQHEVYSNLPYEPNKPLVARGLIKEQKVQVNKPAEQQVLETKVNRDGDEIVVTKDEKGNIFEIRFIKSFTAKLIQSPEETKKYYEELKNEVLSYKKTNSRISWHFDSVNSGRNYVLKFAVRGKTLCVYLPLNADDYADSKYKVEKVESKKYEDVPCMYRIKNDRRCAYAKELIGVVANSLGLEKGEEQHEVYSNLPYEENKPLIARGLIKEQKVQVNKPAEGPIVLESKVNSEGDEVLLTKDSSGNLFEIRYIKSFTAKLSQSEAEVKDYYTLLKNYVMSYKDVHSRVSWHYDAINVGRDYVLKFAIRGKTLCVYFALDASKLDDKYKVEEAKGKKFEDVPCLYRIKNDRRCEYAKELIDLLMKEHGLNQGDIPNEDYRIKKESTKALLDKGLIKEVKSKVQDKKVIEHYESITVSKADEVMSDKKAESYVEEVEVNKHKEGSKVIINIDTLSKYYNNGDEVTLDSLIEKGLVPSKVGHIKVLARGELDKKLHVVANEYSLQAIKMIVLVGGTVKKIK